MQPSRLNTGSSHSMCLAPRFYWLYRTRHRGGAVDWLETGKRSSTALKLLAQAKA